MAYPTDLHDRLAAYLAKQQTALKTTQEAYRVELSRLPQQIAATERVLALWDAGQVATMLEALAAAGIQVTL